MACPYFYPVARLEEDSWAVPPRLPLGDAYSGQCRASTSSHPPDSTLLRISCNSGYARARCERFPKDARADAVRFNVATDKNDQIKLLYIFERECWPVEHGELEYSVSAHSFTLKPADEIVARQAEAFLESYLRRAR